MLKKISKKRKLYLKDINKLKYKLTEFINLKFSEFQLKNLKMAILAAKLCGLKEQKFSKY